MKKLHLFSFLIVSFFFGFVVGANAQSSVSLRSQWLDPTNLFTEDTPTIEFTSDVAIGGPFNLHFYYAHDIDNRVPIYLIGGINYNLLSKSIDSLVVNNSVEKFPKMSTDLMLTYQYFHTLDQLSAIQPVFTVNRYFVRKSSTSVHTLMAEFSPWMSIDREEWYQDGYYLTTKYNYAKFIKKWKFDTNLSAIAVQVIEEDWDAFVLGAVLGVSAKFLPLKTSLDIVLNKPLITDDEDDMDFTIGITKEF